jgi:hypothetical protein
VLGEQIANRRRGGGVDRILVDPETHGVEARLVDADVDQPFGQSRRGDDDAKVLAVGDQSEPAIVEAHSRGRRDPRFISPQQVVHRDGMHGSLGSSPEGAGHGRGVYDLGVLRDAEGPDRPEPRQDTHAARGLHASQRQFVIDRAPGPESHNVQGRIGQ